MDRRTLGSWISGPSSALDDDAAAALGYRGQRLGLPEVGPGSIAGVGIRVLALLVDWLASLLISRLIWPGLEAGTVGFQAAPLAIFALEVFLFTWTVGGSFGQLVTGLRVQRLRMVAPRAAEGFAGPAGLLRALVRTLLLCLLVPPLVWDRDSRGLHDRIAGTVLVRARSRTASTN